LFVAPVFAVRFTQPVGRRLRLVSAIAFARELIKPKPATRALNLAKLITGAGGQGIRESDEAEAAAVASGDAAEGLHGVRKTTYSGFFGGERRVRSALSV
jgi:hypothetical protein